MRRTERRVRKRTGQVIAVIIIAAVLAAALWFVGRPLLEEYLPGTEHADLGAYLGLTGVEDAVVMIGGDRSPANAVVRSGIVYWDAASIRSHFTDLFWINANEGTLLLTTADEVVRANAGELSYARHAEAAPAEGIASETVQTDMPVFFIERGQGYIALDYVKQFANFTYELFTDPYRVQIYAEDGVYEAASVLKKTSLRQGADIKSEVLCGLSKGDTVYILDRAEGWSKVRTSDAITGYVENRRLTEDVFDVEILIPQDYTPPPYTALTEDRKLCIAWHLLTNPDANANLAGVLENAWPLDVISPTWYEITDSTGAVKSIARKSYVDEAHARGLKVWPLASDFTDGLDRTTLLMSTASRNAFVSYLIGQAKELGFDGFNLDFELAPEEAASGYEQLVRELSVACRAHGLVFSIDNYPPREHTEHYNRKLQGEVADYVIVMSYDEHWGSDSGVGSVASLPFVKDAIERTLAVVPAHKTINAVPFYTRIWNTARDNTVRFSAVGQKTQAEWIKERKLEPVWDEILGQYYAEIDDGQKYYQVWLEDEASMQTRTEMMKGYALGGVACWQIGLESDAIWDILGAYTRG